MKNILIVDDEPDIREILRYNLEKAGFNITEASSGDDALNKLSKNLDLAILDIMMPGNDGYDVCKPLPNSTLLAAKSKWWLREFRHTIR